MKVEFGQDRKAHWIKANHQCRIPKRWVAIRTKAETIRDGDEQIQRWSQGTAIFWRHGLKGGDYREDGAYNTPEELWEAVSGYCRPEHRTIVIGCNIGDDIRLSRVLEILPQLGFELEWCNLDRNVSTMTWRSDHGSIVFCDLFTWLPMPLHKVAMLVDGSKLPVSNTRGGSDVQARAAARECEVIYMAKTRLVNWIADNQLGNWQPTGAGMAYATWRHGFMDYKVLVHDSAEVIERERMAMHTGRAEAWRHGILSGDTWHEIDMRAAYTRIAAECELPQKLKFSTGPITQSQYEQLTQIYRVNCQVDVDTLEPIAPTYHDGHTLWPTGRYSTTLWDVEVNELLASGASVNIRGTDVYTKANVLGTWARWIISQVFDSTDSTDALVRAYAKHCGRALIGRFSLRSPRWEYYGTNITGETGLSYDVDSETGIVRRMMHVGSKTYVETARVEGRDSCPQITGWVMAKCRMLLWEAMHTAGTSELAHVDTDAVLVSDKGLARMREVYGTDFDTLWQVKGTWTSLDVYGPRNLRTGRQRKMAGIPVNAREGKRDTFTGEMWASLAADMSNGRAGAVTVTDAVWTTKRVDPRRQSVGHGSTHTRAIRLPADD